MTQTILHPPVSASSSSLSDENHVQIGDRSAFRILHITDLHLRSARNQDSAKSLAEQIVKSLEDCWPIDFIAITGDLLDNGSIWIPHNFAGLTHAQSFVKALKDQTGVSEERIRIVPGNHDYKWSGLLHLPKAWRAKFDDFFDKYSKPVLIPWRKTGLLFVPFDSVKQSSTTAMAKGVTGYVPGERPISTTIPAEFTNPVLPIALIHHHPLPVPLSELEPHGMTPWKRFFWKTTNNPSSLLLQDAGKFLAYLHANNFRLVLHGHLHRPGHWCLYSNAGENEVWLDIVSSASLFQAGVPSRISYSIVEISSDLALGGFHRTYEELPSWRKQDSEIPFPPSKATRGHSLLRRSPTAVMGEARKSGQQIESFERQCLIRCKEFVQYWHVGLHSGKLTCIKHIRGLSADDGAAIGELYLPTSSIDHSLTNIGTHSLTERRDLEVVPTIGSKEEKTARHKILLRGPLSRRRPQDIICRCDYSSLLPRDQIDLDRMGYSALNTSQMTLSQRVIWQCERLVTLLTFDLPSKGLESTFAPPSVSIRDTNGLLTELQPLSDHAFLDAWPVSNLPKFKLPELGTGALMLAYRLKPGSEISITWAPPKNVPRNRNVSVMQSRLLDHRKRREFTERYREEIRIFMNCCAEEILDLSKRYHPGIHRIEDDMFLILYCLSKSDTQYKFVPIEEWPKNAQQSTSLEWAFADNIVTRAFRYCECNYFVGSAAATDRDQLLDEMPSFAAEASYLLAVPILDIFAAEVDGDDQLFGGSGINEATLVLLLGSKSEESELSYAAPGSPLMDEFISAVQIWGRESFLRSENQT